MGKKVYSTANGGGDKKRKKDGPNKAPAEKNYESAEYKKHVKMIQRQRKHNQTVGVNKKGKATL